MEGLWNGMNLALLAGGETTYPKARQRGFPGFLDRHLGTLFSHSAVQVGVEGRGEHQKWILMYRAVKSSV